MNEKPKMIPMENLIGPHLVTFLDKFNEVMKKELDTLEKDIGRIEDVIKHHCTME
jgi:hypothetical protein